MKPSSHRHINQLANQPAKPGSWRSYREQLRHNRQEVERDLKVFLYILPLLIGALVVAVIYLPQFDGIDRLHPLYINAGLWVVLLITLKVLVGKRKMW